MLPCHSCHICGTWRSKEVGGLKLSYGRKGNKQEEQTKNKRNIYGRRHKKTTQQRADHWATLSGITYLFQPLVV